MVDAIGDVTALWIMLVANLIFLAFRLFVRRQQRESLRLSDYLLLAAFGVVVAESVLLTYEDAVEINFIKQHPIFLWKQYDPVTLGITSDQRTTYSKVIFAVQVLNFVTLWLVKSTFLTFFHEIFPRKPVIVRRILYICMAYVIATFLANLFQTVLWCRPLSRNWAPQNPDDVCMMRLDLVYESITFAFHITSTIIIIFLPITLLGRVELQRRELTFALTVMSFGLVSIAASIAAYITLTKLRKNFAFDQSARHAAAITSLADQNAIFLAACLSVIRLRFQRTNNRHVQDRNNVPRPTPVVHSSNNRLVIAVEKSWSVHVDIMESWGHEHARSVRGGSFENETEMESKILSHGNTDTVSLGSFR